MLELFQVKDHADGSRTVIMPVTHDSASHKTKDLSSDGQNACQILQGKDFTELITRG